MQRLFSVLTVRRLHCHLHSRDAAFQNPLNFRVLQAQQNRPKRDHKTLPGRQPAFVAIHLVNQLTFLQFQASNSFQVDDSSIPLWILCPSLPDSIVQLLPFLLDFLAQIRPHLLLSTKIFRSFLHPSHGLFSKAPFCRHIWQSVQIKRARRRCAILGLSLSIVMARFFNQLKF